MAQMTMGRRPAPRFGFGDRLRLVRRDLGVTQAEMAMKVGVGLKAYSAWESGQFEVAQLHRDDVTELPDGTAALLIRGKGRKVRAVPLHPKVAGALAGVEGFMFPSTRTSSGHLSPGALGDLVSDLLGPGWSGHTLRHRAASDWYAVDRDLVAVQRLLGHASIATTQIYVAPPPDAMTAAVLGVA